MDNIANYEETHRNNLVELIHIVDTMLHSHSTEKSYINGIVVDKSESSQYKQLIIELEDNNNKLNNENKLLKLNLEESQKSLNQMYEKYEQV